MGLRESLILVGHGLGVEFDNVSDEVIQPIVAEREVVTQYLSVTPGQVAGVHQTIYGKGRINASLELRMYVGAEDVAADRVIVTGVPNVEMVIKDGVHGDRATAAMVVNAIPRVVQARAGMLTMDDIPVTGKRREAASSPACCPECRPPPTTLDDRVTCHTSSNAVTTSPRPRAPRPPHAADHDALSYATHPN